jgi:O-antigen/teichoic acid export membrane protein
MVAVPVCLGLTVVACATPGGVPVVFGERWQGAAEIVPWACLGLAIHAPLSVGAISYLYARGDAQSVIWSSAANATLFLLITAGGLPLIGLKAIGIGWAAASGAEALVLGRAVRRHSSSSVVASLLGPAASALVGGAIGLWISYLLGNDLIAAIAATAVGASLYLAMVYLTSRATIRLGWALLRSGLKREPRVVEPARS